MNNHINFYDFMKLWHWKNKPLLVAEVVGVFVGQNFVIVYLDDIREG